MEIFRAVTVLKKGGIIIFPTETLYGIGAIALYDVAVKKVFSLKSRPLKKPLPVIIGDIKQLDMLIRDTSNIPLNFIKEKLWPGPISVLFPAKNNLPQGILSHDGYICVRLTSHNIAKELSIRCKYPLVATSANISGRPSPMSLSDIDEDIINKVDYVVSCKPYPKGDRPSTIIKFVDKKKVKIIRYGAVSENYLNKLGIDIQK